jgi:glyoxylase-like metal-dependent hydrolase (beta-lactamase superfamily II)
MEAFICLTCGTRYPPRENKPERCLICTDERQYVGLEGQQWTTLEALRQTRKNAFDEREPGLTALLTKPPFAIGQRAFFVESAGGNFLWDCVALLDEETRRWIHDRGGLSAIAISHPHYYTTMAEWSRAFGGVPVYLHSDDREWVVCDSPELRFWAGDTLPLHDGVTLIRCGGHFAGGTVMHWPAGAGGKGVLLTGDVIQVVPDRRWVSFMYSYPNYIPLSAAKVKRIAAAVEPFQFERLYGAFHPMEVTTDGKAAIARSVERYLAAIRD